MDPDVFDPFKQMDAVRSTLSPISKPSVTAASPAPNVTLPSAGQLLKSDNERFRSDPRPKVDLGILTDIADAYENTIGDTWVGKALTGLQRADKAVFDAKKGALDTATFGASRPLERGALNLLGDDRLNQMYEQSKDSTAAKVGEFAGYLAPGLAAEKLASMALKPLIKGLPTIARGAIRGGAAGALDMLGQETGDVAFRQREFDPLNIALGAGIGGAAGAAVPLIGKGIKSIADAPKRVLGSQLNAINQIDQVGREGLQIDNAVARLADIDEQIASLGSRGNKAGSYGDEAQSLLNDRAQTIDYIKRADPEFQEPSLPTLSSAAEAPVTAGTPQNRGVRANYQNQLNNGNFSPELQQRIRDTDQTYDIVHNVDAVAEANKRVSDLPRAEANFITAEAVDDNHIATGYRLMQELDALGEHDRAFNIADKLAKDLTKIGQSMQAAKIISRLSPEGQLVHLARVAAKNNKPVTVAEQIKFKELAAEVQDNIGSGIRANKLNEILDNLEQGKTVSNEDMKQLSNLLDRASKYVKTKAPKDQIPKELKDVRTRDKVIKFFDDAESQALARIQARKNRLNALPIDEWADHAIVVASQIIKGGVKAASHVDDMVRLFGNEVRPHAAEIFAKAQKLANRTTRNIGAGKVEEANRAFRKLSGEEAKEKVIVQETATLVRKLIDDAKVGILDQADVQKLRDYSDEIAEFVKPSKVVSDEQKYLQTVKSLAKKIAQVESEKVIRPQANKEVEGLLRQVAKLTDEVIPPADKVKVDTRALSDIAHDVLEKTRPTPKPTSLQEKIVEKYIKDNPVKTEDISKLRELARQVTELSGDDAARADMAMQKILNSYEKANWWDRIQALRYISMLLNTHTQLVNTVSGPIMASTGTVADVFGTMIDISMSKLLKQPRTTTLYGTNPLKFIANWLKNAKVGAKAGWEGVNPSGIAGPNEIRGLTYKSLKNVLGIAERSLGAVAKGADYGTYKSVQQSEMKKIAYLDAVNNGIKGKQNIQRHIEDFMNNPPDKAILQADRIGKNTTFQRNDTLGGSVANFLSNPPGKAKVLKPVIGAIFPFVRTPVNIASTAVTMTPAGIIKGLYQLTSKSDASRREAIRTLSLGLTGTGLSALGYYLSNIGIITGANDSGNKDVDAVREQAGHGKYRFNTSALLRYLQAMGTGKGADEAAKAAKYREGDKQFDYNKLQPLAFPLAIGAGLENKSDGTATEMISGAGKDAYGSLYGMSTLKGVQDVFQPSYGGTLGEKALGAPTRVLTSFLKSFSPSALAQEARREDPFQRKTSYNNGILEDTGSYFKTRTPGLSQSLPPNKTTLGKTKENAKGIAGSYLNPYRSEVAPYSEAAEIVSKLIDSTGNQKLAPSAPSKTIDGTNRAGESVEITIPADRYARYQEELGNAITSRIVSIPNGLTDEQKAERVLKIYKIEEKRYSDQIKRELGIRITR
ncbi:hypothetical protein J2T14_004593 [Paenibacillus harenae]|nr:hypothetical protein [Paenibacillus harenae]